MSRQYCGVSSSNLGISALRDKYFLNEKPTWELGLQNLREAHRNMMLHATLAQSLNN